MEINENWAELIGIIIGDGNIYRKNNKYRIGFVGDIINDKLYFEYIKDLIKKEWKKDARIFIGGRGIRIVINSKEICQLLIEKIGLPYGEGKSEIVTIPKFILEDWNLTRRTIRGITDTDGSVFAVKKPGVDRYPSIEITTNSKNLALQIRESLMKRDFRVANIWSFKSKMSKNTGYRFGLNGKINLQKWVNEIGFSNPYKLERAISYLN